MNTFPNAKNADKFYNLCGGLNDPELAFMHLNFVLLLQKLNTQLDSYFNKFGLTVSQVMILIIVFTREYETPSSVAAKLGVTKANINGVIKTMVKKGHIRRIPNLSDKRSYYVRLTKQGRNLLTSLVDERYKLLESHFGKNCEKHAEKLGQSIELLGIMSEHYV